MPITLKVKTVFHCKCIRPECGHEWDTFTKPKRCARCKYRSWNGEDHRLTDPFEGVPIPSQIKTGTAAPRLPNYDSILESFIKARDIIEDIIKSNPCNHQKGECVCAEIDTLAEIDQQIEKLRGLKPRRSTYLANKKQELTEQDA